MFSSETFESDFTDLDFQLRNLLHETVPFSSVTIALSALILC